MVINIPAAASEPEFLPPDTSRTAQQATCDRFEAAMDELYFAFADWMNAGADEDVARQAIERVQNRLDGVWGKLLRRLEKIAHDDNACFRVAAARDACAMRARTWQGPHAFTKRPQASPSVRFPG